MYHKFSICDGLKRLISLTVSVLELLKTTVNQKVIKPKINYSKAYARSKDKISI